MVFTTHRFLRYLDFLGADQHNLPSLFLRLYVLHRFLTASYSQIYSPSWPYTCETIEIEKERRTVRHDLVHSKLPCRILFFLANSTRGGCIHTWFTWGYSCLEEIECCVCLYVSGGEHFYYYYFFQVCSKFFISCPRPVFSLYNITKSLWFSWLEEIDFYFKFLYVILEDFISLRFVGVWQLFMYFPWLFFLH